MSASRTISSAVLLLAAFLEGGCGSSSTAPSGCQADADCGSSAWCLGGVCQQPYGLTLSVDRAAASDGKVHVGGTLNVSVAVTNGTPPVELRLVDERRVAQIAAPYAIAWDTTGTTEGSHRLVAVATGGTREYQSAAIEVVVDRTRPAAPTLGPVPSPTNQATIVVTGTAEEKTTVRVRVDGAERASQEVTNGGTWSATVSSLPDGAHVLEVTATDLAGNESGPASATVVVDRSAPTVLARTPTPGTTAWDVRRPISVTFSKPMATATLAAISVTSTTANVPVTTQVSADRQTVRIVPLNALEGPASITVALPATLTDDAGNRLVVPPDTWSFSAPTWLPVGDGGFLGALAVAGTQFAAFTSGPDGTLYVATTQDNTLQAGSYLRVHAWDGQSWRQLGSDVTHLDLASPDVYGLGNVSLRVGPDGRPVVTWVQPVSLTTSSHALGVRRWNGTEWIAPAANLPLAGIFNENAMALDEQGNLFVAWTYPSYPDPGGGTVNAARLSGSSWVSLGGALSSTALGQGISLAILGSTPYVAFQEGPTAPDPYTGLLRVRSWTGTAWRDVGDPVRIDKIMGVQTELYYPNLVAAAGRLLVAFREDSDCGPDPQAPGSTYCNRRWIRVAEWDGTTWQALGGPLNHDRAQSGYYPSMVLARGRPVVAWKEYPVPTTVFVSERPGADWVGLGGANGAQIGYPVLAVDPAGAPVLAWDQGPDVHVMRLNR